MTTVDPAGLGEARAAAQTGGRAYTLAGQPRGERRIADDVRRLGLAVEALVGEELVALLLVGGYGRGDGGITFDGGAPAPHNDYDLIVVVRGHARRWREPLRALGDRMAEQLGVHVDLWPVDRARVRTERPRSLLWLDISLGGARVVRGDRSLLSEAPITTREVPFDECGRLLMNRAVGLALSALEAPDRVAATRARHAHKMVLALGDVLLLAVDRYAADLPSRLRALETLHGVPAVDDWLLDAYRGAVTFQTRPDLWHSRNETRFEAWYRAVGTQAAARHLRFEAWRVGAPQDPVEFVEWRGRLFAGSPDISASRACVSVVRGLVEAAVTRGRYMPHPRERLARVAVGLAYGDGSGGRGAALRLLGLDERAPDARISERLRRLVDRGGG